MSTFQMDFESIVQEAVVVQCNWKFVLATYFHQSRVARNARLAAVIFFSLYGCLKKKKKKTEDQIRGPFQLKIQDEYYIIVYTCRRLAFAFFSKKKKI